MTGGPAEEPDGAQQPLRAPEPEAEPTLEPPPETTPETTNEPTPGPVADTPLPDRRHPSTIGGAIYLVVLGVVGASLVLVTSDWRLGIKVFAGGLTGAAAARLVLPQRDAGMLAVRHRLVDVALLLAFAVALWLLAENIPNQPGL